MTGGCARLDMIDRGARPLSRKRVARRCGRVMQRELTWTYHERFSVVWTFYNRPRECFNLLKRDVSRAVNNNPTLLRLNNCRFKPKL